jgi:hypothetical protein
MNRNRYQASTPRVAAAIAAIVMTLITFGVTILVPAMIESGGDGIRTQAAYALPPDSIDRIVIAADVEFGSQG